MLGGSLAQVSMGLHHTSVKQALCCDASRYAQLLQARSEGDKAPAEPGKRMAADAAAGVELATGTAKTPALLAKKPKKPVLPRPARGRPTGIKADPGGRPGRGGPGRPCSS